MQALHLLVGTCDRRATRGQMGAYTGTLSATCAGTCVTSAFWAYPEFTVICARAYARVITLGVWALMGVYGHAYSASGQCT